MERRTRVYAVLQPGIGGASNREKENVPLPIQALIKTLHATGSDHVLPHLSRLY